MVFFENLNGIQVGVQLGGWRATPHASRFSSRQSKLQACSAWRVFGLACRCPLRLPLSLTSCFCHSCPGCVNDSYLPNHLHLCPTFLSIYIFPLSLDSSVSFLALYLHIPGCVCFVRSVFRWQDGLVIFKIVGGTWHDNGSPWTCSDKSLSPPPTPSR